MGGLFQLSEPLRHEPEVLSYEICGKDRIVAVSQGWPVGPGQRDILNRSLWDLLGDGNIADVYRALITEIRRTRQGLCFTFRCDDISSKRVMSMVMTPIGCDGIRLSSRPIAVERQDANEFLRRRREPQISVDICPRCGAIKAGEHWRSAASALDHLGIFAADLPFRTWQILCPRCRAAGH